MKKYEFFCVCAQELSDEEISSLVSTVVSALSDAGATHIQEKILGKQRLAYPFPGRQAYGTYVFIVFDAEPEVIDVFKQKIRFEQRIVRSVVRLFAADEAVSTRREVSDVASVSSEKHERVESVVASEPEVEVRKKVVEESKPAEMPQVEEKTTLSQEELDKRIDALLNEDIDPEHL